MPRANPFKPIATPDITVSTGAMPVPATALIKASGTVIRRLRRQIVPRSIILAVAIGTVLTLINQPAALLGAQQLQMLPTILVFSTPMIVVSLSQWLAIDRAMVEFDAVGTNHPDHGLLTTATAHGIPLRAICLGLLIGSTNTAIVGIASAADAKAGNSIPLSMIAQSYLLPMLFSLLSQAISFRRATTALSTD